MGNERARKALEALLEGNRRFAQARALHPRQGPLRREQLAASQEPVAAVLGCADSRVPPEIVFDQGLGDLFVVRVAGNVPDPAVVESLEYAATRLEVPLLVVLGHSSCGAVTSVVRGREAGEGPSRLAEYIAPSVAGAEGEEEEIVERTCRNNVRRIASELARTGPHLETLVRHGRLEIVPACYELTTGTVEIL